jgi:VanZ family protein
MAAAGSVLWMGVIYALSSLPPSAVPGRFGALGHFGVYAVLGVLYLTALSRVRPVWLRVVAAVALATLYGITDEFHQSFVPNRSVEVADVGADLAGGTVAAALALAMRRWIDRRRSAGTPDGPAGRI